VKPLRDLHDSLAAGDGARHAAAIFCRQNFVSIARFWGIRMLLRKATLPLGAALLACMAAAWCKNDPSPIAAAIKSTLESRFPDVKILDVQPSPAPHLYEVFTGDGAIA